MNRGDFAAVVAAAYIDQFNRCPVMNEAMIIYNQNSEEFYSQSSLTPVASCEVVILSLEDGMFGDVNADAPDAEQAIQEFLLDPASDEIWRDVVAANLPTTYHHEGEHHDR